MLTLQAAQEYLEAIGVSLPDAVVTLLVEQANSVNDCLDAHYPPTTADLIRLYLLGLLGTANADRYVSSQTAPSGASQSFRFKTLGDRWRSLWGLLKKLDTHGCTDDLVPPDPSGASHAGIWTAKGGCI